MSLFVFFFVLLVFFFLFPFSVLFLFFQILKVSLEKLCLLHIIFAALRRGGGDRSLLSWVKLSRSAFITIYLNLNLSYTSLPSRLFLHSRCMWWKWHSYWSLLIFVYLLGIWKENYTKMALWFGSKEKFWTGLFAEI